MKQFTDTQETQDQEAGAKSQAPEELAREAARQMGIIRQGAAQLVGEEELEAKILRFLGGGKPLTVKFGMDPSAPDLHLGHAVALRKLRQIQRLGHKVVIVIGDFTGRIGDPTGKAKGRKALSDQEVLENAQTYQEQVFHILDRDMTQVRYNGEWLELLQMEEVLRLASTVTVARMLERDDFANRFKKRIPIGLHEFLYPLMQAYDSVALEADLELGGTDQTFNILMGRSLLKDRGMEPQAALFMPILTGLDGVEKMSKSLGNYVGIYEDARTMFKKVMEVPDSLIITWFELTTDILPQELDEIRARLEAGCNPRDVKLILARTVTSLYHGEEEASEAERFFEEAFVKRQLPSHLDDLSVARERGTLHDCIRPLVEGGLTASGSEFRRILGQGGVQINGETVRELEEPVRDGDVLKIGKKKFVRIRLM